MSDTNYQSIQDQKGPVFDFRPHINISIDVSQLNLIIQPKSTTVVFTLAGHEESVSFESTEHANQFHNLLTAAKRKYLSTLQPLVDTDYFITQSLSQIETNLTNLINTRFTDLDNQLKISLDHIEIVSQESVNNTCKSIRTEVTQNLSTTLSYIPERLTHISSHIDKIEEFIRSSVKPPFSTDWKPEL